MDGSNPKKSEAAATRKRRSSILKSQRSARAPLSELELTVATPEQAKSRRVSFSRRTGVAEFEINEATTAWKNVYEEHNKSNESSANESGLKAAPRRVGHLGSRAAHFEENQAVAIDTAAIDTAAIDTAAIDTAAPEAPPPRIELAETHDTSTQLLGLHMNPGLREPTDTLNVDFSEVAPLAVPDDLDVLQQDLAWEPGTNISEYSMEVDFNATHFTLKPDDDDMSVTDTIRSPAVTATATATTSDATDRKSQLDWKADKENINPYIPPPPADFASDVDDILVFDGKKCKFQSDKDLRQDEDGRPTSTQNRTNTILLDDMTETQAIPVQILANDKIEDENQVKPQRRTVLFDKDDGDISVTQAICSNIVTSKYYKQKTLFLDDMTETQAVPPQILLNKIEDDNQEKPRRTTTVFDKDDGDLSVTQAIPVQILENTKIENEGQVKNILEKGRVKPRRQTVVFDKDDGDMSVTQAIPVQIVTTKNILEEIQIQPRRQTVVFDKDDGDMSVTQAIPVQIVTTKNILGESQIKPRRHTVVFDKDDGDISVTQPIPVQIVTTKNILEESQIKPISQTVVFDKDDADMSVTQAIPVQIVTSKNILEEGQVKLRRQTVVFDKENGDISVTQAVPMSFVDPKELQNAKENQKTLLFNDVVDMSVTQAVPAHIIQEARRKSIVYGADEGHISMTEAILASALLDTGAPTSVIPKNKRRGTIVYENDNDISVTELIPTDIHEARAVPNVDGRRTIVYGNDDGNVSMTGVVSANIVEAKIAQQPSTDRGKTIVYGSDDGNVSMTGVVPTNLIDEAKAGQGLNMDRSNTVYHNNDGNVSITGVVPINILEVDKVAQGSNADRRKSVVNDNGNLAMTDVIPTDILGEKATAQPLIVRRRQTIVYDNDGGNISMTGVVTANILDGAKVQNTDRERTVVYGTNDGSLFMTGAVPLNVLCDKANTLPPNTDRRKTIAYGNDEGNISMTGVVPGNIINEAEVQQHTERRQTVVYENDCGNLSMTGVVSANILDETGNAECLNDERRKTIVYGFDEGNVAMTGVVPAKIIDETKLTLQPKADRRKTIVYDEDNGDVSMTGVVPVNILGKKSPNVECRKTVVYETDGNTSMIEALPANIFDGEIITQPLSKDSRKSLVHINNDDNISVIGVVLENKKAQISESPNTDIRKSFISSSKVFPVDMLEVTQQQNTHSRKTIVSDNDDADVSMTDIIPAYNLDVTNAIKQPNTGRRKTVVYDNDDADLSMTGVVPGNTLDKEPLNVERRKTVVYENDDANLSMTGVVAVYNLRDGSNAPQHSIATENSRRTSMTARRKLSVLDELLNFDNDKDAEVAGLVKSDDVSFDTNDVSMTNVRGTVGDNVIVPETPSGVLESTEQTQQKHIVFEDKDEQNEMLEAVAEPVLVESDDQDNSMLENPAVVSEQQSFNSNQSSATYTKSSAGPLCSTSFEKPFGIQSCPTDNSLPNQFCLVTLGFQGCPSDQSLTKQASTTFNKSLQPFLVYDAATAEEIEGNVCGTYAHDDLKSQEISANASLSSAHHLKERPSTLDALLDMSQASAEAVRKNQEEIIKTTITKPNDITETKPVGDSASDETVPNRESFILLQDSYEEVKEEPALDATEPLASTQKKRGIVGKLHHRLSELKDMLHSKEKSPKKSPKSITAAVDETQTTVDEANASIQLDLEKDPSLIESIPETETPKTGDKKIKSLKIDLSEQMSVTMSPEETKTNVTRTDAEQSTMEASPKLEVNDTRAILDALSDFTDTRRSGEFEANNTRRSSAPVRKSIAISAEDFRRDISMAQALMKSELAQTEMDINDTEGSTDEEPTPGRVSRDVVKTLRFEDDESILESKVLQKPKSSPPSPRRGTTVIPNYPVNDYMKELMNDLVKPMVDIAQPLTRFEPSRSMQSDSLDSSQIDLVPYRPVKVEPRSCLRRQSPTLRSEIKLEESFTETKPDLNSQKGIESSGIIVFDHLNPLNNILLPPVDQAIVHKYEPSSQESVALSLDSRCVQTESSTHDMAVGAVAAVRAVGAVVAAAAARGPQGAQGAQGARGARVVAVDRAVEVDPDEVARADKQMIDSEVNTSIVMKGNRELLAASSSLTLVDDALAGRSRGGRGPRGVRSPVRVIFSLADSPSSVQLSTALTSGSASPRRPKRGHSGAKGAEVTPKPATKVLRSSVRGRQRSLSPRDPSPASPASPATIATTATVSTVTVAYSSEVSGVSSIKVNDWQSNLLHELSSKDLATERDSGVNVVAKIDVLPFMGTSECDWESRANDTWTFKLLRAHLRLIVRLEHRATNTARSLVRADTPVQSVLVQHAREHEDKVAGLCLRLTAESLQRVAARGVARAGAVPGLLRTCSAVARVALRWGRAMRAARAALAFSLLDDSALSLKVANIPLRSVWEVTFRIELCDPGSGSGSRSGSGSGSGRGVPYPRAAELRVARVVAAWTPPPRDLDRLLAGVPQDWGHVPRTIWRIFKYLKNKRPDHDLL